MNMVSKHGCVCVGGGGTSKPTYCQITSVPLTSQEATLRPSGLQSTQDTATLARPTPQASHNAATPGSLDGGCKVGRK